MRLLSVLVAQFPVSLSIQRNLEMIETVLEQTRADDWVLFPEGSVSGYSTDPSFLENLPSAEVLAGLKQLQAVAERRKINVWVGACLNLEGKWFNTAQGFSADGKTQVYRKINLANRERGVFSAGDQLPVFEWQTPEGKLRFGIQICRELRFPEQWGWLARSGAQVIFHLNNAVDADEFQAVWKSHLVSRAAETQRYVLSANNAAPQQTSPTLAVGPDGHVLGEIVSADLEVLRVELDLSKVSDLYLNQSRADVVALTVPQRSNVAGGFSPE